MRRSVWESTLGEFREELARTGPAPAGVSLAATTSAFALSLLVKTLEIASKRQGTRHDGWIQEALALSAKLAQLADEDAAAFDEYLECLRLPKDSDAERRLRASEIARALRVTIEIPMQAARSIARGIVLTEEALGVVHAFVAPDLGAAAALLAGSVRGILLSVGHNLGQVSREGDFFREVADERQTIERDAIGRADAILARLTP